MITVIGGATASGKSDIAVGVAEKLNGEIISADSMQIYRRMNIGTAKVTEEEKRGIPHYMIDIIEPQERFSAALFEEEAKKIINDIESRGKVAIVAGGTGLYIRALLYGFSNGEYDETLRLSLLKDAERLGEEGMWQKLRETDAASAEKIHPHNVKRVIRALEYKILTGKSISEQIERQSTAIPHRLYAVDRDRDVLYERINRRVDGMLDKGLVSEIEGLLASGVDFSCQSMQAIGYKEFKEYFEGTKSLAETAETVKKNSRNYAKRQLTWFRSEPSCVWLKNMEKEEIIDKICTDYYKNISNL